MKKHMFELIMVTISLMYLSVQYKPPIKDIKGCFPDYRPGFKCFVFEKLP